jgi:hypothetical protein
MPNWRVEANAALKLPIGNRWMKGFVMSQTNSTKGGVAMNRKYLLTVGITAAVLAVLSGLATSAQQMTMDDAKTQDQNWAELMKSMKAMHAAMATAQPSGNDDEDFVNLMLPHHEAAVEMAKAELLYGSDPQMRRLAQEIITDQQSEIQLMRFWLDQPKTVPKNPHQPQSSGLPKEK